jgi:hypothetical protein
MQVDYLKKKQRVGEAKKASVKPPDICESICHLLGISPDIYDTILSQFLQDGTVYTSAGQEGAGRTGITQKKPAHLAKTKTTRYKIHLFIRDKRKKQEKVTIRQVMEYAIAENMMHVDCQNKVACKKRLRKVLRLLQAFGYQRHKRTGYIVPTLANLMEREEYLRLFFLNRRRNRGDRLREVYVDEGYIHEHYHGKDVSSCNPDDGDDVKLGKDSAKERSLFFATAIQGPDPRVAKPVTAEDKAGLVPNSLWLKLPRKLRMATTTVSSTASISYSGGSINFFQALINPHLLF